MLADKSLQTVARMEVTMGIGGSISTGTRQPLTNRNPYVPSYNSTPNKNNLSGAAKPAVPSSVTGLTSRQAQPPSRMGTMAGPILPSQNAAAAKPLFQNQQPAGPALTRSQQTSQAQTSVSAVATPAAQKENKGFWGNLFEGIGELGSNIKDGVTQTVSNVLEAGKDGVKNLVGKGSELAGNAKGALGSLLEAGKNGIQNLLSKGSQAVEGTKELLSNALETGKAGVKSLLDMGGQAVDGLKEIIKSAPDTVQALIEKGGQAAEAAKELISSLPGKAEEFFDKGKDLFWSTAGNIVESGAEILYSIQEGFNDFEESLPAPVQDALGAIADFGTGVMNSIGDAAYSLYEMVGDPLLHDIIPKEEVQKWGPLAIINPLIHSGVEFANSLGINTAAIGASLLDMEPDLNEGNQGIYHAKTTARQSLVGYNNLYDLAFDIGTDIAEPEKLEFEVDGQDYVLWGWKGDYLNLGAGAELGLYKRMGDTDHWLADPDDPNDPYDSALVLPMTMKMTLEDGTDIGSYSPEEDQWWITTFNSNYMNIDPDEFSAEFTVDLSGDEKMREAIERAVAEKAKEAEENGETSNWSMSVDENGKPILKMTM